MEIDSYQRANMRIGEIASSAEHRMDERFQNLWISLAKFLFSMLEKILYIFQVYNIENHQIYEIAQSRKLVNFQNLTIRWTIEIPKISNLLKYHIYSLSIQKI